ncbi:MAG: PKD domain-containing protein [Bacteroidota bacterium]
MQKFFTTRLWAVLLLLMSTLFITSCGGDDDPEEPAAPAPTADFTFAPDAPKAGDAVTFTNTSQNATTYAWEFGDGGTSSLASPSHTFEAAGTYTVKLTATGEGGEATTEKTVTVAEAAAADVPVASFDFSPSPAKVGEAVSFTFTGENAVSYAWDFQNDGTIDSEMENPMFTYDEAGAYSVKLTVIGADGTTAEAQRTITVEEPQFSALIVGMRVDAIDDLGTEDFPGWLDPFVGIFDLPIDQITSLGQAVWVQGFANSDEQNGITAEDLPVSFPMDFDDNPAFEITDLSKPHYMFLGGRGAEEGSVSVLMYHEIRMEDYVDGLPAEVTIRDESSVTTYTLFVEWVEQ